MSIVVEALTDPAAVAEAIGVTREQLARDDAMLAPLQRWFAWRNGVRVGIATAFVRADDRLFVTHRLDDESAFGPLLRAAVDRFDAPLHVSIRSDMSSRRIEAERMGFGADHESVSFDVPFATALHSFERVRRPLIDLDLVPADRIDADALFELDIALRNDVPGIDGWRGHRDWFDDEMSSPEFDPAGYVVAQTSDGHALVGLIRIWRQPDGPALGMVGVLPTFRTGVLATALLHEALSAAQHWGSPTFSVNTAHPSLHRRLRRLGARESGGFVRLRRTPTVSD